MPSGRRAEVARQAGRRRPELLQAAQRVVGGVEAVRRQLDVVELAGVLVEPGRKVTVDVDPLGRGAHMRAEERRVGKESVSTGRSRGSHNHSKKKKLIVRLT